jgi:hypothetical protein
MILGMYYKLRAKIVKQFHKSDNILPKICTLPAFPRIICAVKPLLCIIFWICDGK